MTWRRSKPDRRSKQAKHRRKKQSRELRSEHWLTRHEAEREELEEAIARRIEEEARRV